METLLWVFIAINLAVYYSTAYFIFMFVRGKNVEIFKTITGIKKFGMVTILPILTCFMAVIHLLTKSKETPSDGK